MPTTTDKQMQTTESFETSRRRALGFFSILCTLAILVVEFFVATYLSNQIREQITETYVLATTTQVSGTLNSLVTEEDLREPFGDTLYREFGSHVRQALRGSNVVRVKLWRQDGTVLYSNNKSLIGKKYEGKENLSQAFAQKVPVYEMGDLDGVEHEGEQHREDLLEVILPGFS